MRYFALACDYDGTIAHDGRVDETTIASLIRFRRSDRKLILVTGREVEDLLSTFSRTDLFDLIVAENGAVLYSPHNHKTIVLGERPPDAFVTLLRSRGVGPISVGHVIVATWEPHENSVIGAIRDLGLEHQIIFNKGAVMVLPAGINKASGLNAALAVLGLSPHNVVGVGDAENDHSFLALCECSVAVSNALPMIKERVDLVTGKDHGAGVSELIERILTSDLKELAERIERNQISLGFLEDERELKLDPYESKVLIVGKSESGKTTVAAGIVERLIEKNYQLCIIDPEGDYLDPENFAVLGSKDRPPEVNEIIELLTKPDPQQQLAVNLLGIPLDHRPAFFGELSLRLHELRIRTGRPHWIIIDEVHHMVPFLRGSVPMATLQESFGMMMITLDPSQVSPAALAMIDTLIVVGETPENLFEMFCQAVNEQTPEIPAVKLEKGEALYWRRGTPSAQWFRSIPPTGERRRHHRKYIEGDLPEWSRFYFTGPEGKLSLSATNLMMFLHLAEGVGDEAWLYHLQQGDYSRWFRDSIKDEELAQEASDVERQLSISADKSRQLIRQAIEARYTGPARP
jgi:hydroxymethylpyrimidine pyrophosphatase-like HAD family hydrolase